MRDVDLMRLLLVELRQLQRSPPEAFLLPLEEMARRLGRARPEIVAALDLLAALAFIEAPGAYGDNAWIFRKLTRRGETLLDAIADAGAWREVKQAYGDAPQD